MGSHSADGPSNGAGSEIELWDLIRVRALEYEAGWATRIDWRSPTITNKSGNVGLSRRQGDSLKGALDDVDCFREILGKQTGKANTFC
jgi:hypothetical protein